MEIQLWRERLLPYELAVHELVEKVQPPGQGTQGEESVFPH